MPTDDQLRAIMPGCPDAKRQTLLPFLQQAIDEFGIAAPARQAAFLAQLAHESGQFRFMEEIWGPTAQQLRYEPVTDLATRLGNSRAGDGKLFKGRGPIQLTGRANYQRFGGILGVDLIADPPRAATPEVAFRIAGLFWQRKGLNELADQASAEAFREITRRINGGFHGLPEREKFYGVAKTVFEVTGPAAADAAPTPGPAMAGRRGLAPASEELERGLEAIIALAEVEVVAEPPARRAAPKRGKAKPRARKAAAKKTVRPARRAAARKSAKKAAKKPAKKTARKVAKKAARTSARKPAGSRKATPRRRLAKKR